MALQPDALVDGKYRIRRALGEGGVGVVYVAEHVFLKKLVALKVLRAEMAGHPQIVARFEQEARATSSIEHENVVRVTDFGRTAAGECYLVMELIQGRTLADELQAHPVLPPARAVELTRQILLGLEAAHAAEIVHRDLKPENVLLCERTSGRELLKVVDFGIALLAQPANGESLRLTREGTVVGTPYYMAPEQARGLGDLDARVDVHAVGVMLYEMLGGRRPYEGESYNSVLFALMTGKPRPLVEVVPGIDPPLAAIVMRALAHDRAQRWPTAAALREALDGYAATYGLGRAPTLSRAAVASPHPALNPPLALAAPAVAPDARARWPLVAGAVALLLVGATLFALLRPAPATPGAPPPPVAAASPTDAAAIPVAGPPVAATAPTAASAPTSAAPAAAMPARPPAKGSRNRPPRREEPEFRFAPVDELPATKP